MNLVFYFYVSCFLYNAYEKKQINTPDCQLPMYFRRNYIPVKKQEATNQ